MMTHKEMTAHIRKRLKASGVKARVDMIEACGVKCIRVYVPAFDATFTDEEQRKVREIAKLNRLTRARREEIDVDRMTDPKSMHFEYHQDLYADLDCVVGRQPQPAYNKDERKAHA